MYEHCNDLQRVSYALLNAELCGGGMSLNNVLSSGIKITTYREYIDHIATPNIQKVYLFKTCICQKTMYIFLFTLVSDANHRAGDGKIHILVVLKNML